MIKTNVLQRAFCMLGCKKSVLICSVSSIPTELFGGIVCLKQQRCIFQAVRCGFCGDVCFVGGMYGRTFFQGNFSSILV